VTTPMGAYVRAVLCMLMLIGFPRDSWLGVLLGVFWFACVVYFVHKGDQVAERAV
jgi:hypothetical protein